MIEDNPSRQPGEIIYHFDVSRNSIPLSQFLDTARATQDIIDNFNESLFDNKVKYSLHVKTPEEGSLIEVLAVLVAAGGSILGFLGTDIGKAFFKGLTGDEPATWSEKLGASIRQSLSKTDNSDRPQADGEVEQAITPAIADDDVLLLTEAEAIAFIIVRFLEVELDQLRKVGITPEKFRGAFQGRNKIIKACIDNTDVQGLTFDRTEDFRLRRKDFPRLMAHMPDLPPQEEEPVNQWSVVSVDIVVNSPNWKRDGRKWQAATSKHQDIAFSVEDEQFWSAAERKQIQPDIRDNMRVQWAYPAGHAKPSNVRVLRVLNYNGKPISTPLSDEDLQAQLKNINHVEADAPDLFDERRSLDNNKSTEAK